MTLAGAEWMLGNLTATQAAAAQSLELARSLGFRSTMTNCLLLHAAIERAEGAPRRAAVLLGAVDAFAARRRAIRGPRPLALRGNADLIRDELTDSELEDALAAGRAIPGRAGSAHMSVQAPGRRAPSASGIRASNPRMRRPPLCPLSYGRLRAA